MNEFAKAGAAIFGQSDFSLNAAHPEGLAGADLRDMDMRGADLSGMDLTGVNLEGADFTGAKMLNTNFTGANLKGADFSQADMNYVVLTKADLEDAKIPATRTSIAEGFQTNFKNATFLPDGDGQRSIGGVFIEADFSGTDLKGVSFAGDFSRADFTGSNLAHAYAEDYVSFDGADFSNAKGPFRANILDNQNGGSDLYFDSPDVNQNAPAIGTNKPSL